MGAVTILRVRACVCRVRACMWVHSFAYARSCAFCVFPVCTVRTCVDLSSVPVDFFSSQKNRQWIDSKRAVGEFTDALSQLSAQFEVFEEQMRSDKRETTRNNLDLSYVAWLVVMICVSVCVCCVASFVLSSSNLPLCFPLHSIRCSLATLMLCWAV